jgi:hypothetical protein
MPALIALTASVVLGFLVKWFRDLRNWPDAADLFLAAFQYFAGIAAFISLMIFLWSL